MITSFNSSRFILSITTIVTLYATPVTAQQPSPAEELFQRANEKMAAGQYKEACPLFNESYRLDPLPGALFALADCHAYAGDIASAWRRYDDYLRAAELLPPEQQKRHEERMKKALSQKQALLPEVPELTLILPATAPQGTRVKQDGVELKVESVGVSQMIDPGEHVVTILPPGGSPTERRFTIEKGEKKRLLLRVQTGASNATNPSGEARAEEAAPKAAITHFGGVQNGGRAYSDVTQAPVSGRRIIAYGAGAIGFTGLGVGILAGAFALSKKSFIEESCAEGQSGTYICTEQGYEAAQMAQSLGLASTIGFGAAVAGLAVGTTLLLTEPKQPKTAAGRRVWVGAWLGGAGGLAGVQGGW
jgi:hypothetical protein